MQPPPPTHNIYNQALFTQLSILLLCVSPLHGGMDIGHVVYNGNRVLYNELLGVASIRLRIKKTIRCDKLCDYEKTNSLC